MSNFRTVGCGTLLASLLLATITVTGAYAAPEFGRCVKLANGTGGFANAGCTKPGGSAKYAWQPTGHLDFELALAGSSATFQAGPETIACSSATGFGEYAGSSQLSGVHIADRGCQFEGTPCSSLGQETGEITSEALEGTLGVIAASAANPAKSKVGLDLSPPAHSGPFFSEYLCAGVPNEVTGSIIVPVKTNKMLISSSLKYATKRGAQKPEAFEGQARDVLLRSIDGSPPEAVGAKLTLTISSEEPIEIRAGVE